MGGVTFRYDYFVIWANGLNYKEEILTILREEEKLEIVEMKTIQISDMEEFILDLYALDSVPMKHLQAKVEFLHGV